MHFVEYLPLVPGPELDELSPGPVAVADREAPGISETWGLRTLTHHRIIL